MTQPWFDRLQEAAYTGPDGTRIPFTYVDLKEVIRKNTPVHELAGTGTTFVEDTGLKGDQFPMQVIFHGDDHDLEAKAFVNVLKQTGAGRLEHPMYGVHTVVPFGDIARHDRVVTAGNQTIFDVTFWATVVAIFPSADSDSLQLVDDAVRDYDVGGAQLFQDSLEIVDAGDESKFKQTMTALKDGARDTLRRAQDGTAKLQNRMDSIDRALQSTIDTLIGGPLTIATQLRQLTGAPARSLNLIKERLAAYKTMLTSVTVGEGFGAGGGTGSTEEGVGVVDPGTAAPGQLADANNTFHANRVGAEVVVLATAQAVAAEKYTTRREALEAAFELAVIHDEMITWSEANYAVLFAASAGPDPTRPHVSGVGAQDTGESRVIVQTAVARAISFLIASSFSLGIEQAIVTTTPTSPLSLCARLYGPTFLESFDDFMDSNQFSGDEILEIPAGTTVRYYAE